MNSVIDLNTIWFFLVGLLFAGYAILDGFDLGIGALHLLSKNDRERRTLLNAIGPVWDGNEVWLVTGGGALFAAFPEVYATAFSGFYMAFILLLFMLIFRAVAIDFRSKQPMRWWRNWWDFSFSLSSILTSLLIGVALGNIAMGIPLNEQHEFVGSFRSLLNPYALLIGITTVALFMMHGSIYGMLKTEGDLHDRIQTWSKKAVVFFVLVYAVSTLATLLFLPHMSMQIRNNPVFLALPILNVLAIINLQWQIKRGRDFQAFLSSCAVMLCLLAIFGLGIYPNMILSTPQIENTLTIYNAASSGKTLRIMLVIAIMGIPLVLAYTASIYWIFRGKVKLDANSY